MLSVMMSNNNYNDNDNDNGRFEWSRPKDVVFDEEENSPRVLISGSGNKNDKLHSKSNSFHGSISLMIDDNMNFQVCGIKIDEEKSTNVDIGENEMMEKGEEHVSDHNSMLSKFDECAKNGKSWDVGYGFEIGDMVWGKVKSHPWWPGHIYNEAFASHSVRRSKTQGHVLVAFFGDSSYGWFDPADELIPFEPNFVEKSKQATTRNFVKAVEEAVDEVSRRSGLGLTCLCRNPNNFRPTGVEGFFAVDVGDDEPGEIFSASQIKRARDSFKPREMFGFVKKLSLTPMLDGYGSISFIKHKAAVLAYRKAVFEEFDETYSQAFGPPQKRPASNTPAVQAPKEPSRAPLSGRMVIADALGKGKASVKPNKAKVGVEKDKYLFKRRDEANELNIPKATKGKPGSSNQSIPIDENSTSVKVTFSSLVDQSNDNNGSSMAESFEFHSDQSARVEESGLKVDLSLGSEAKLRADGSRTHTEVARKKLKVHKRSSGELNSEVSLPSGKKKKKEIGAEMSSDGKRLQTVAGKVGASIAKVAGKLVHVPAEGGEGKVNNQMKGVAGKLVQVPSAVEGDYKIENRKENVSESGSMLSDSVESRQRVSISEAELRCLVSDLHALALNPFHGLERSRHLTMRKVFLKFRSLVYQKSLASLPTENESREAHTSTPAGGAASDNSPVENLKEMPSPPKPDKPSWRPEDPTAGGRKRRPSDRQEEMAAKKKKKIDHLISLTTEKKPAPKASEAFRGNPNAAVAVKSTAPMPAKAVRPEAGKRTGMVVKAAAVPTMLIMKFPPGGTLPSLAELKAKFARFGPLDQSRVRVFWQSLQCRLVYQHKSHAQEALKFANNSNNLFGNTNVKCFIRDLAVEMPESESTKVQREDASIGSSQSREPVVEQRQAAAKFASQPLQQPVQLKSCLKRPLGDDAGGGRGARVKFMLGGEESNRTEQLAAGNRNFNNSPIFADATMENNRDNNFEPQLSTLPHSPNNVRRSEFFPRSEPNFNTPPPPPPSMPSTNNIDIAHQMLSLLIKCNDVVNNLTEFFGYVPYHPL